MTIHRVSAGKAIAKMLALIKIGNPSIATVAEQRHAIACGETQGIKPIPRIITPMIPQHKM